MKYEDLINSHIKYGIKKGDIIKKNSYDKLLENVVIAPWWEHDIFENSNNKIEEINNKLYNIYGKDYEFSFIELKQIGSPVLLDEVLSLGLTKCKNLVFIGSAGALDSGLNIGDIVIPKYSICGEGASRYLNNNLEDEFGKKKYPSLEYTNKMLNILNEEKIKYYYLPNYSVDTIFAQFVHIDKIIDMGAKTIEMETSTLFKCNEVLKINITAIFSISDNSLVNKSLYNERTKEDDKNKHRSKYEIIPNIIEKLFSVKGK